MEIGSVTLFIFIIVLGFMRLQAAEKRDKEKEELQARLDKLEADRIDDLQ